jgi:hypothetical protein
MKSRKSFIALTILLLLPLASCQPQLALHSWYNEKDLVLEPGLAGTWLTLDDKGQPDEDGVFTIAQNVTNGYTVTLDDATEPEIQAFWEARLFRVNGQLFIDAVQLQTKYKDVDTIELFIPGHFVGTVKLAGDKLSMRFLDDDWISEALKANPAAIKHNMIDSDTAVLIASTAELRDFASAHAGDEKAFSEKFDFVRKK